MIHRIQNSLGLQVLGIAFLCLLALTHACNFPDFVQSNITGRDWKTKILDQNADARQVMYNFSNNLLHVVSPVPSVNVVPTHLKVCLQDYGDNKFLVAHEEQHQDGSKYSCIQIIQRGDNVFQLKTAPLDGKMDKSLCDDGNLQLNPWLVIDQAHVQNKRISCPLQGGFDIFIYDKMRYEGVCDVFKGQTRLESQCEDDNELTFLYRRQSCVPDGLMMYATQPTHCLENWQHGPFTFTLIKHEKLKYMWVFRFPTNSHTNFISYVFRDLVGDVEFQPASTQNYLRLDMVRNNPVPLNGLCFDDHEGCSEWADPCVYGTHTVLTCPKKCGLCNDTFPTTCSFDIGTQGSWYEVGRPGQDAVSINNTAMVLPGGHTIHCKDWNRNQNMNSQDVEKNDEKERMLATVPTNGCRPRYMCAKFKQDSSQVMFMKISRSKRWPLTRHENEAIDCSHFQYENIPSSREVNKFQSRFYTTLMKNSSISTPPTKTQCDIDVQKFQVIFKNLETCSGVLTQPDSMDSFRMNLTNCSQSHIEVTHTCIEYTRLPPSNDLYVITQTTVKNSTTLSCWMFPKRPKNRFYLLGPSQCNEASKRKIKQGRLKPKGTFTKVRKDGVKPTPPEEGSGDKGDTEDGSSEEGQGPIDDGDREINDGGIIGGGPIGGDKPPPPMKNITAPEASGSTKNSSPFIVASVLLVLVLAQLPCWCKGKAG